MGLLLHISDLHLGKNEKEEQSRIKSLAEIIKREQLNIKQVIFTGDVIDSRVNIAETLEKLVKEYPDKLSNIDVSNISNTIDDVLKLVEEGDSEIVEKYNTYLKENAVERMRKAAEIINGFLKNIGVEREKFISCCGNHDRLRFLGSTRLFDCGVDYCVDETVFEEEYLPYNEFCKNTNYNLTYKTQKYDCEELHYIIANSNWRVPEKRETNNACINCSGLSQLIYDVENDNNSKTTTIFLSHKPFDDICEYAKYRYEGNDNYITVKKHINRATFMSLYGDKHSYNVDINNEHSEFMCGLPLCNNDVHYNLIDYSNDKGVNFVKFIIYNNNSWNLVPATECVSETYDLCKKNIKSFALQLALKKDYAPHNWEMLFSDLNNSFNNGRFDLIKTLFRECATIYDSGQNKVEYRDDNIFEDIFQIINCSEERRVLALKGEPGTGKSTFLSIQYIYLLKKFFSGGAKYIPFYIDMDILSGEIYQELRGVFKIEKIIDWYREKFNNFINQVVGISGKYKLPPCVIIDGLDTKNIITYTSHTVEYYYYQLLEDKIKKYNGKYIMGLNTHKNMHADKSFEQADKFEYACFLNKVFIVPYKNRDHYTNFIAAYLKLTRDASEDEIDIFYNNLKKLRRISVDLDYIHGLDRLLKDNSIEDDSWKIMKKYLGLIAKRVEETFGENHKEIIYKAAYLLFFQGYTFQLMLEDKEMQELSYEDFLRIRNNREVAKYLIARHYIEELKYYASHEEIINEESILNCFISRDISVIIRIQIEDLGLQAQVFKSIINKHSDSLQGYFKSFVLYLLGHNKNYNGLNAIKFNELKWSDNNYFLNDCINRSYKLAEIVSGDDDRQQQKRNEFLLELMTNEKNRLFNRIYQLWYYEDLKDPVEGKRGTLELNRKVGKGFDFHNSFMFLVSKIDFCYENNKTYPLLEVDIFTLCDLIYSRLQNFDSKAMFYSADYNGKENSVSASVLNRAINIIDHYLARYDKNDQNRNLCSNVLVYFQTVKEVFEKSLEIIKKKPGQNIDVPFVSPAIDFEKVVNLCEMPRVGWNITKTETIYKRNTPKYNRLIKSRLQGGKNCTIFETIGDHILESVYIAELFLPSKMNDKDYDKSTVISMLLMSEVGKIAVTYDYTPDYNRASKDLIPKECNGRKQFLIQGAFDGYADLMKLYDAMQIVGGALNSYSDINMRICQEIKLIQMEYKFYTLKKQLKFEKEREIDFKKEFVDLLTPACKDIRRMLVTNNVNFEK